MSSGAIPAIEFLPGTLLAGRLKVLRRLGAGGVGAVYEIEHQVTRHRRALKILHPRFRQMPEVVERFLREGSAAGRIGNPHIVETFDAGELDNGAPWLLMELLAGEPLSEVLRRTGRLDFGPACGLLAEVAIAVQAAHDAGIVHRDLKPDNLYVVERDGRPFVKVLDFGMSKFDSGVTGAVSMTAEGTTLGTPLYMAPEQMRGAKDVDGRADVYALGVILYEALAGGVPYNAGSFAELAVQVLGGGCTPLDTLRPEAPAGLSAVVHRAMAIDPAQRFSSARELAEALRPYAQLPSDSGAWWRPEGEPDALGATAVRATPGVADHTFPSTPSPMPSAPRKISSGVATALASMPHTLSSGVAPPVASAPGLAAPLSPPPPSAPPPVSLNSSGFKRPPSLTRRLRRLGVLSTVFVVGFLYTKLKHGNEELSTAGVETSAVRPKAMFGGYIREFGESTEGARPLPPVAPPIPTPSESPSGGPAAEPVPRGNAKKPSPPRPPSKPRCCEPTHEELLEAAANGALKIRGPQVSEKALVVAESTVSELHLSADEVARIEKIFADSKRRTHVELLKLNATAGSAGHETESNAALFDRLRDLPDSQFRATVQQLANERAGLAVRDRSKAVSIILQALDFVVAEDEGAIVALEATISTEKAAAVMASFKHFRVFRPPDPEVARRAQGGLDKAAIAGVVVSHVDQTRACRRLLGKREARAGGTVELHWTIDPAGAVTAADIAQDSFADPAFAQCLLGLVRTWKFPAPTNWEPVQVTYPFRVGGK